MPNQYVGLGFWTHYPTFKQTFLDFKLLIRVFIIRKTAAYQRV